MGEEYDPKGQAAFLAVALAVEEAVEEAVEVDVVVEVREEIGVEMIEEEEVIVGAGGQKAGK